MRNQSSLGGRTSHRLPAHMQSKIGRVTSVKDYEDYGKIEVVFLDYGMPFPVWVVGELDRKPVTGDQVIVGYMEGRKDAPYLAGFIRNETYTSNFIQVQDDKVRLQLPVFDVGVRNGDAHKEVKDRLIKDTKPAGNSLTHHRAYMEITPKHAMMSFPVDKGFSTPPAEVELTPDYARVRFYRSPGDYGEFEIGKGGTKVYDTSKRVTVESSGGVTIKGSSRTESF